MEDINFIDMYDVNTTLSRFQYCIHWISKIDWERAARRGKEISYHTRT